MKESRVIGYLNDFSCAFWQQSNDFFAWVYQFTANDDEESLVFAEMQSVVLWKLLWGNEAVSSQILY